MALLITTEGKPVFLKAHQANLLWLVKTGERQGTVKTRAKVKQIAKWYLNRNLAPPSYIAMYTLSGRSYKHKLVGQVRLPYIN